MTNDQKAALARALGWRIVSEIGGVYVELPDGRHPDLGDSACTMPLLRELAKRSYYMELDYIPEASSDSGKAFWECLVMRSKTDVIHKDASTPEQAVFEAAYAALVEKSNESRD